jgi:hypothetical protein
LIARRQAVWPERRGGDQGIELSLAGDVLQLVEATFRELESGPSTSSRTVAETHTSFRGGQRHDPCSGMDRETADISRGELNLAAVDSRSDPDAKRPQHIAEPGACANRPRPRLQS